MAEDGKNDVLQLKANRWRYKVNREEWTSVVKEAKELSNLRVYLLTSSIQQII
jgi:hypothetical protein